MAGIRFEGVTKRYANGFVAVEDLNLEIHDKEFVVLLGPSGCGKSTTLNMIAGLEEVTEGNLWFDEEVMNTVPADKRDIAMVFQSYALYPHKSVYENIAFGLRMRKVPQSEVDRRVRNASRKLDIAHLLDRRPNQLSGGQRQRVALGRAMVREPAVFLMDEPLSNLDAALRISMRAEIKQLHAEMQTTFIYVTHDQAEALTLADRIVVMKDGRIQQIGTPHEIYEQPRSMFVASFLGNPPINFLEGSLEADGDTVAFSRGGLKLKCPPATAESLKARTGAPVVLGIRAEDVADVSSAGPGTTVTGMVTSVLPIGSDQFLGVRIEDADLYFRVSKDHPCREGAPIALAVPTNRLHLFDKGSGLSLLGR
jgi:multiple sugar transport system ATP-binding protein